ALDNALIVATEPTHTLSSNLNLNNPPLEFYSEFEQVKERVIAASIFCLAHEYAHHYLNHEIEYEPEDSKEEERMADKYALESLERGGELESETQKEGLICLLGAIMTLDRKLRSPTHIDDDRRLKEAILHFAKSPSDHIWTIGSCHIKLWSLMHNRPLKVKDNPKTIKISSLIFLNKSKG
ncbi:hypothetical protein WDZ92_06665, partial [Nostoc sp. NIES-2111]